MDDVILRLLREEKERANTKKVSYEGAIWWIKEMMELGI
jgi:hypothetical protein